MRTVEILVEATIMFALAFAIFSLVSAVRL